MKYAAGLAAAILALAPVSALADLLVLNGSPVREGKIVSSSATEITWQSDGDSSVQHLPLNSFLRAVITDEHGATISVIAASAATKKQWIVPLEPAAPPVVPLHGFTYYVVPFHGEVGVDVLASTLEQDFADAASRKPTVVVLDVDSPGGMVEEAQKIFRVIHKYNKTLRIIALTDKDLSAAAIVTLSVPHIFVKSSSTIGAATSYISLEFELPGKIEEKMQSAWRADARNSAEEGGHEPLLADAMIDNDLELHLEIVGGKKVIKTGPGPNTICRKGKVLTLSSREAVNCGLADAMADDYKELGAVLNMKDWTECKGLAALMSEYLPHRAAAFNKEYGRIGIDIRRSLLDARSNDPSVANARNLAAMGTTNIPPVIRDRLEHDIAANWKIQSLNCVAALQRVETDMTEAVDLCEAFKQEGRAEAIKDSINTIAHYRAEIYDSRNKYQDKLTATVVVAPLTRPVAPAPVYRPPVPVPNPGPEIPFMLRGRPRVDTTPGVVDRRGYFPTIRPSGSSLRDSASLDEALSQLGPTTLNQSTVAAVYLRDAAFNEARQKEVVRILTPYLDEPDSFKRAPFVEAFAAWARSEETSQLVKILQTPSALPIGTKQDGNERCWGPAAFALAKINPDALAKLIPDRKSGPWWRTSVYWALLARTKDPTTVASARELIQQFSPAKP